MNSHHSFVNKLYLLDFRILGFNRFNRDKNYQIIQLSLSLPYSTHAITLKKNQNFELPNG